MKHQFRFFLPKPLKVTAAVHLAHKRFRDELACIFVITEPARISDITAKALLTYELVQVIETVSL
jgi:hypothetical protein